MPQRFSQGLVKDLMPGKPQNTGLRDLRCRIRAVQKSRSLARQLGESAPNLNATDYAFLGDAQSLADRATEEASSKTEVGDNDVVLNFENMDQDCALRPITTNSMINTSDTLRFSDTCRYPSTDKTIINRPQTTPDAVPAGHTRLTTDERGQLRYFGYSSLMRMVSILPPSSPSNSTASTATAAAASGAGTLDDISQDVAILADSAETHHHLMDLFFRYQHAALPVLDEAAFRESYMRRKRSEYYSTFLLHSLLLRALKFSVHPHADQLKIVYLRRIRRELLFEIENPSIATIPALCMFGSYMAGEGSDRACWLYPGTFTESFST
jgi:hypothetical protein